MHTESHRHMRPGKTQQTAALHGVLLNRITHLQCTNMWSRGDARQLEALQGWPAQPASWIIPAGILLQGRNWPAAQRQRTFSWKGEARGSLRGGAVTSTVRLGFRVPGLPEPMPRGLSLGLSGE